MLKVSFMHTGDIHLGSAFDFDHNGELRAKERRLEVWEAFEKIVRTAAKNELDLLLIAGNLFDHQEFRYARVKRVADLLGTLEHTQVVIAPGREDYYRTSNLYGLTDWPANVTVFTSGRYETAVFPALQTAVHGLGWTQPVYDETEVRKPPVPLADHYNIFLLNGAIGDGEPGQLTVAPGDLSGYDYVALGGRLNHAVVGGCYYPGCPEPLDFSCSGEHGIIVGKLAGDRVETGFSPGQKRFYRELTVAITPEMTKADIKRAVVGEAPMAERLNNFYRLTLTGCWRPETSLAAMIQELQQYFYYLEVEATALGLDFHELSKDHTQDLFGELCREILKERQDFTALAAVMLTQESLARGDAQ